MLQSLFLSLHASFADPTHEGKIACICELLCFMCLHEDVSLKRMRGQILKSVIEATLTSVQKALVQTTFRQELPASPCLLG